MKIFGIGLQRNHEALYTKFSLFSALLIFTSSTITLVLCQINQNYGDDVNFEVIGPHYKAVMSPTQILSTNTRPWPSHELLLRNVLKNKSNVQKIKNLATNQNQNPLKSSSYSNGESDTIGTTGISGISGEKVNFEKRDDIINPNQKTFSLFNNLKLPFQVTKWRNENNVNNNGNKKGEKSPEIYLQVGNTLVKQKPIPNLKTNIDGTIDLDHYLHHHHKKHHHKHKENEDDSDEEEGDESDEVDEKEPEKEMPTIDKNQQQQQQMQNMSNMMMNGDDYDGLPGMFSPSFNTTRGKWIFNKGRWIFFISSKPVVNVSMMNQNSPAPTEIDTGSRRRNETTSPQFISGNIHNSFDDDNDNRYKSDNQYFTKQQQQHQQNQQQAEGIKNFITPALENASKVLQTSAFHKQVLNIIKQSSADTSDNPDFQFQFPTTFGDDGGDLETQLGGVDLLVNTKSEEKIITENEFVKFKIWRLSNRTLTLENEKDIPGWILKGHKFKKGQILNIQDIPPQFKRIIMEGVKLGENHDFFSRQGYLNSNDWMELPMLDPSKDQFEFPSSSQSKDKHSLNYVVWNDNDETERADKVKKRPTRSDLQKYLEILAAQNAPLKEPSQWKRIENYLRQMALSTQQSKDDYLWAQLMQEDKNIKSNFATAMLIMSILERNKGQLGNLNNFNRNQFQTSTTLQPQQTTQQQSWDPLFLGILNSRNTTSIANPSDYISNFPGGDIFSGSNSPNPSKSLFGTMNSKEKELILKIRSKKNKKHKKKKRKKGSKKGKKKKKKEKSWISHFFPSIKHNYYNLDFEFGVDLVEFIKNKLVILVGLKLIPMALLGVALIHFWPTIVRLFYTKFYRDEWEYEEIQDTSPELHHHYYPPQQHGNHHQNDGYGHGPIPYGPGHVPYFKKTDHMDDIDDQMSMSTPAIPPGYSMYSYDQYLRHKDNNFMDESTTEMPPGTSNDNHQNQDQVEKDDMIHSRLGLGHGSQPSNSISWMTNVNKPYSYSGDGKNNSYFFKHGFNIGNTLGNLFGRKNKEALNVIIEDKKDAIVKLLQMWNLVDGNTSKSPNYSRNSNSSKGSWSSWWSNSFSNKNNTKKSRDRDYNG